MSVILKTVTVFEYLMIYMTKAKLTWIVNFCGDPPSINKTPKKPLSEKTVPAVHTHIGVVFTASTYHLPPNVSCR